MNPTKDEICSRLASETFGEPLVSNMYRGLVAEAIVRCALPENWTWCSADWAGWDFKHEDGTKLEVKQSAALQTWSKEGRVTKCSFGIASATGYYDGDLWVTKAGRQSSIYVFGHHPVTDPTTADHRDPEQWQFYCLPASALPKDAASIGLRVLDALCSRVWREIDARQQLPCRFEGLAGTVEALRMFVKAESGLGWGDNGHASDLISPREPGEPKP